MRRRSKSFQWRGNQQRGISTADDPRLNNPPNDLIARAIEAALREKERGNERHHCINRPTGASKARSTAPSDDGAGRPHHLSGISDCPDGPRFKGDQRTAARAPVFRTRHASLLEPPYEQRTKRRRNCWRVRLAAGDRHSPLSPADLPKHPAKPGALAGAKEREEMIRYRHPFTQAEQRGQKPSATNWRAQV